MGILSALLDIVRISPKVLRDDRILEVENENVGTCSEPLIRENSLLKCSVTFEGFFSPSPLTKCNSLRTDRM